MHRSPKARRVLPLALGCCLALALLVAAPGVAEGAAPKLKRETRQTYERQLAAGEIRSVRVNKKLGWLRLTLNDGRQVVYRYPPKSEPALVAQVEARHVPVTVVHPHPHHKLRYIAGGILVALIVVVGAGAADPTAAQARDGISASAAGQRAARGVDHRAMDACEIAVRLQPRASASEIVGEREGVLVVRVTAPPVEGRANDALCRLIAKRAGVGMRSVTVVRGAGSREKVVRVLGMDARELRSRLTLPGPSKNKTQS